MASRQVVAQRFAGLVILAVAVAVLSAALLLGPAGVFAAAETKAPAATGTGKAPATSQATQQQGSKTVTDIRIDDEGVRVGTERIDTDEGIIIRHEGDADWDTSTVVRVNVHGKDEVRFGDDVIVDEGEVVQGDAVAIVGSVLVNGVVEGDAVAVGGSLTVGPRGRVNGDGVAIGGTVSKEPGAVIRGQMVSVGKGGNWISEGPQGIRRIHPAHFPFGPYGLFSRTGRFFFNIVWLFFVLLLTLIIAAIARSHVERVTVTAKRETFKMGLIGLLTEVLVIPVIILFCITIIGIPIGLVVIPLLLVVALLLGYTAVGLAVGERFANGSGRSIYWSVVMGILILEGLRIISSIVRIPGGPIGSIGWVIAFIAWAVIYVAATVGLGAVVMTRFGTRPYPRPPAGVGAAAAPTGAPPYPPAPGAPAAPTGQWPPTWQGPTPPATPGS